MSIQEFQVDSQAGSPLYGVSWPVETPRAVICLVHGLGEHCRRYDHLASFFNDHQIAVVAYDQKGHGKTKGQRGHTPSMEAFLDDVEAMLEKTRGLYPDLPVILYGHSMGGNIVLNYLTSRQPRLSGVITTGAFVQFVKRPPAIQLWIGKLMRWLYPKFSQPNGLDIDGISRDKVEVEKYKADPLVHGVISAATAVDMIATAKRLQQFRGRVDVPLLLMHGGADRLTAPAGSREFSQNISGDVTYREWKGLYHEIHNEFNRQEVFDYTLNWIKDKVL